MMMNGLHHPKNTFSIYKPLSLKWSRCHFSSQFLMCVCIQILR